MPTALTTTPTEPEVDTPHKEDTPTQPTEDTTPEPTTRLGWHARLAAWVKDHPKLAALLAIAL